MSLGRLLIMLSFATVSAAQQSAPVAGPTIQIVEGDGAINSIRLHRGHDPIVRIVTPDGQPIAGAAVTFLLPSNGPSGTFGTDGGLSLTVESDSRGIAAGRGLRPNDVAGQFRIRVNTAWHGAPAAINLSQINAEPVVHNSHTKAIVILVAIVAAAGGGAALAASGHSSNSPSTPPSTSASGSIISGTPVIGPPH